MIGTLESGPIAYIGRGIRNPRTVWGYNFIQNHELDGDFWTETAVSAGAGTSTFGDATGTVDDTQNGEVTLLTAANEDDGIMIHSDNQWVRLNLNTHTRFGFRGHMQLGADDDNWDWFFGLTVADTTPIGGTNFVADGVMIGKDDGNNQIDLNVAFSATALGDYTGAANIATDALTDAYVCDVGIQMDPTLLGSGYITVDINGAQEHAQAYTGIPHDVVLGFNMGVQAGSAVAREYVLDYVYVDHAVYP